MLAEILCTILAFALVQATIVVHELGHATAMRRYAIEIEAIAIGMGPVVYRRNRASGPRLELRLLPIGGFVQPADTEYASTLPPRALREVCGQGVANSVWAGLFLMGLGDLPPSEYPRLGAGFLAVSVAAFFFRRAVARWFLLLGALSVAVSLFALYLFLRHVDGVTSQDVIAGPISIAQIMVVHNPLDAVYIAGAISVAVGLANAMPVLPLDGGHVAARWIRERYGEVGESVYSWSALAVFGLMFLGSTVSDVLHLR